MALLLWVKGQTLRRSTFLLLPWYNWNLSVLPSLSPLPSPPSLPPSFPPMFPFSLSVSSPHPVCIPMCMCFLMHSYLRALFKKNVSLCACAVAPAREGQRKMLSIFLSLSLLYFWRQGFSLNLILTQLD